MSRMINKELFLSFLKTIQPDSDTFVFQTFTDDKTVAKQYRDAKVSDPLASIINDTPENALVRIQELQNKGAGAFVQMNYSIARGKNAVTKLAAFFVDTDGADLAPILKQMPPPLMLVESSQGNYHVYWRTIDPLENFKPVQKQLAIAFACDEAMVNLDRVVRIPGTWHLKNTDKPFQVKLALPDTPEVAYAGEELLKCCPQVESDACGASAMITTQETFELPETLPAGDRTRHLVSYAGQLAAQGYGVDTIKQKIKQVMLERLPAGQQPIPDETLEVEIYPAIEKFVANDTPRGAPAVPSAPIANSFTDYVEPVVQRTEDEARATRDAREMQDIELFLSQFYYIEKNCRIVHMRSEDSWRDLKLEEFKNSYGNIKRGGKPLTKLWLEHPERLTLRDIQYFPGKPRIYELQGELMLNNHKGNDLVAVEEAHPAQIQPFLDHVEYLFPEKDDRDLFTRWLAVTIQRPQFRVPWMPLIISEPGVGKGWLYELLQLLMGRDNCAVIVPKDLESGFNEWLFEKTLVLVDELKIGGKGQYDVIESMKAIISNPQINVNIKFGAKGDYLIFPNLLGYSNHSNAAPLPQDDRRFWVHQVLAGRQAPDYYDDLFKWLDTDGPAHVYAWLKALDISKWNAAAPPPMTKAKQHMINSFKSEIERVLDDAIEDRAGPFAADVVTRDVIQIYLETVLRKDRLDRSELLQIKNYLLNKCRVPEDEDNQRFKVDYITQGDARRYMEVVRRFDIWCKAPKEALMKESKRAWQFSLGQQPGANLEAVKTED